MINPDAKTGGKSSRRRASNPESGMLSQSTRMPRPVASPPDAGYPTQSQVCSVNQPGGQDRRQVLQTPGIQPRVRYAQSINSDAKTSGKSSRRRASNPESGMLSQSTQTPRPAAGPPDAGHLTQSQVCSANQPRRQIWRQVLQTPGIQPRVRYAQSINPDAKTGGRSSRRRASNPESGMLS
jgi:hypothetical protein